MYSSCLYQNSHLKQERSLHSIQVTLQNFKQIIGLVKYGTKSYFGEGLGLGLYPRDCE